MSSATAFEMGATVDEPWMSTLPEMSVGTPPLGATLAPVDAVAEGVAALVGVVVAAVVGAVVAAVVGAELAALLAAPVVGRDEAPELPPHAVIKTRVAVPSTA